MPGRLLDEQKVPSGIQNRQAKRLAGDQVIPEINRIEHVATVIAGWNFGDPEQTVGSGAAIPFLELPLLSQERRALHEKHSEGRHSSVGYAVGSVHATTLVWKPVQAIA